MPSDLKCSDAVVAFRRGLAADLKAWWRDHADDLEPTGYLAAVKSSRGRFSVVEVVGFDGDTSRVRITPVSNPGRDRLVSRWQLYPLPREALTVVITEVEG